jgi:hypothetical protein
MNRGLVTSGNVTTHISNETDASFGPSEVGPNGNGVSSKLAAAKENVSLLMKTLDAVLFVGLAGRLRRPRNGSENGFSRSGGLSLEECVIW